VALHRVDFEAVGLDGFGRTEGYGARQLRRWSGQWAHMHAESSDADNLLSLLTDRVPDQTSCSIVHGDFRVDNTILDKDDIGKVLAVVDWELSTLGDPVADVAMMCAYRHSALDVILGAPAAWTSARLPDADELAARYERQSDLALAEWEFYLALAYYKMAVIAEGIDYRYRMGGTTGAGFSTAGDAVPILLAAGLEVVKRVG
jgi:aminoglycoside phosphotransferase (APT) family kinase protein